MGALLISCQLPSHFVQASGSVLGLWGCGWVDGWVCESLASGCGKQQASPPRFARSMASEKPEAGAFSFILQSQPAARQIQRAPGQAGRE